MPSQTCGSFAPIDWSGRLKRPERVFLAINKGDRTNGNKIISSDALAMVKHRAQAADLATQHMLNHTFRVTGITT